MNAQSFETYLGELVCFGQSSFQKLRYRVPRMSSYVSEVVEEEKSKMYVPRPAHDPPRGTVGYDLPGVYDKLGALSDAQQHKLNLYKVPTINQIVFYEIFIEYKTELI